MQDDELAGGKAEVFCEIVGHGLRLAKDAVGAGIKAAVGEACEPVFGGGGCGGVLAQEDTRLAWEKRLQQKDEKVQMRHAGEEEARFECTNKAQKREGGVADARRTEAVQMDVRREGWSTGAVWSEESEMDLKESRIEVQGKKSDDALGSSSAEMGDGEQEAYGALSGRHWLHAWQGRFGEG
jgi:hypothetical protein